MRQTLPFALFGWLLGLVKGQCYSYAGVEMDAAYQPCNGSSPVSMCCHLGVANNGGDECGSGSTYGLCGITGSQLWRESCTDKTWQSPLCLKLCVGVNDTEITACPDGSYCCGKNAVDCCNANEGKFIVNDQVSDTAAVNLSSSQSSQATYASSTSITKPASEFGSLSTSISGVSLSTALQTNTVQPSVIITTVYQPLPTSSSTGSSTNTRQPLSTGAKAGIVVGTGVGSVVLLALAALFWKRRQTKSKVHELPSTEIKLSSADVNRRPKYVYRAEVDGTMPKPVETHGYGRRNEPAEMF